LRPHGNASLDDRVNRGGISVDLHHRRTTVVNQRARRVNDIANADRNIAADERVRCAPMHRPANNEHLFERDILFGAVAPDVDTDRITDGDDVDAGAIGDARHREVVDDSGGNLLSVALHLLKARDCDFWTHLRNTILRCASIT